VLYQTLLYGLLAMGQRDLAWTVAKAAYRWVQDCAFLVVDT
jgi:hypothetical protein